MGEGQEGLTDRGSEYDLNTRGGGELGCLPSPFLPIINLSRLFVHLFVRWRRCRCTHVDNLREIDASIHHVSSED